MPENTIAPGVLFTLKTLALIPRKRLTLCSLIGQSPYRSVWLLFSTVTLLHLWANYKAVRSLALVTFNSERLCLYLREYLVTESSYSPRQVNQWESVFVGCSYRDKDLCGFSIKLGCSVKSLVQSGVVTSEHILVLSNMFRHRLYLLVPHYKSRTVYMLLSNGASTRDVLHAYFHSVLIAIRMSLSHNIPLDIFKNDQKSKILLKIEQEMRKLNVIKGEEGFPLEAITVTDNG